MPSVSFPCFSNTLQLAGSVVFFLGVIFISRKLVEMLRIAGLFLVICFFGGDQRALANEVEVVDAVAKLEKGGPRNSYLFVVTLNHNDEGWEHYADRWEVWTPDGKSQLAVRVLGHPHVNEQPFTRSLSGVEIPAGVTQVLISAHDSKHEDSPNTLLLRLPERK